MPTISLSPLLQLISNPAGAILIFIVGGILGAGLFIKAITTIIQLFNSAKDAFTGEDESKKCDSEKLYDQHLVNLEICKATHEKKWLEIENKYNILSERQVNESERNTEAIKQHVIATNEQTSEIKKLNLTMVSIKIGMTRIEGDVKTFENQQKNHTGQIESLFNKIDKLNERKNNG